MKKSNTTIVIIDDDFTDETPPFDDLKHEFAKVISFKKLKDGVDYITAHVEEKKIVILDYEFPEDKNGGLKVLKKIREHSFITPVILLTNGKINKDHFPEMINQKLDTYAKKGDGEDIIAKIKEAELNLNHSVSGALEEWILVQEKEKREQPYMISANGKALSLNEILHEIRIQSDFGKEFAKDLNALTIHLLLKKKIRL